MCWVIWGERLEIHMLDGSTLGWTAIGSDRWYEWRPALALAGGW